MEIQLDFIPSEMLKGKTPEEKRKFILNRIKKNIIVVLEEGLDPMEEAKLIEGTMGEIDSKDFFGIEFYRMDHPDKGVPDWLGRYIPEKQKKKISRYVSGKRTGALGKYLGRRKSGLTIVGPTRMVEKIKKKRSGYVSMLAKVGE